MKTTDKIGIIASIFLFLFIIIVFILGTLGIKIQPNSQQHQYPFLSLSDDEICLENGTHYETYLSWVKCEITEEDMEKAKSMIKKCLYLAQKWNMSIFCDSVDTSSTCRNLTEPIPMLNKTEGCIKKVRKADVIEK